MSEKKTWGEWQKSEAGTTRTRVDLIIDLAVANQSFCISERMRGPGSIVLQHHKRMGTRFREEVTTRMGSEKTSTLVTSE